MRLSKWTLFCALLVVAALSLAGCMNSGNRADTAMPSPSAGATAGTGSVGDPEGANQSGLQNGAGTGSATPFDWKNNAAQVETALNQISEIADSRVVVSGTTALVAVRYTDAYQGDTTERIREMVAGVVREADPTIQTVAVTSDEDDVTDVYAISDRIRAGENAADMAEEIDRIVRNPTTLR